jgi:hypothetical protein
MHAHIQQLDEVATVQMNKHHQQPLSTSTAANTNDPNFMLVWF